MRMSYTFYLFSRVVFFLINIPRKLYVSFALTYGKESVKLVKKGKDHVFCLRATKLFIFQWGKNILMKHSPPMNSAINSRIS